MAFRRGDRHAAIPGGDLCDGNMVASKSVPNGIYGRVGIFFHIGGGGVFLTRRTTGFFGQYDEVAVWYRALSTNEIASLVSSNAPQISYTNLHIKITDVKAQMFWVETRRLTSAFRST